VRNCTRDEGGPFEVGNHGLISSRCKLLLSKAMVASVAERVVVVTAKEGLTRSLPCQQGPQGAS
jgi:uncharacterized protein YaaW (UPF0174 family)